MKLALLFLLWYLSQLNNEYQIGAVINGNVIETVQMVGKGRINCDVGDINNVKIGNADDIDLDSESRLSKIESSNLKLFDTHVVGTLIR